MYLYAHILCVHIVMNQQFIWLFFFYMWCNWTSIVQRNAPWMHIRSIHTWAWFCPPVMTSPESKVSINPPQIHHHQTAFASDSWNMVVPPCVQCNEIITLSTLFYWLPHTYHIKPSLIHINSLDFCGCIFEIIAVIIQVNNSWFTLFSTHICSTPSGWHPVPGPDAGCVPQRRYKVEGVFIFYLSESLLWNFILVCFVTLEYSSLEYLIITLINVSLKDLVDYTE